MSSLSARLKSRVVARAKHCCEYCLTSQRTTGGQMHIEHIVPLARGGMSNATNLCLACAWCNTFKAASTNAVDPISKRKVLLFNPRRDVWTDHFCWSEDAAENIGLTSTGRATVIALHMNNEYVVPARRQWVIAGWHPPQS
jgi:hypothetical protein